MNLFQFPLFLTLFAFFSISSCAEKNSHEIDFVKNIKEKSLSLFSFNFHPSNLNQIQAMQKLSHQHPSETHNFYVWNFDFPIGAALKPPAKKPDDFIGEPVMFQYSPIEPGEKLHSHPFFQSISPSALEILNVLNMKNKNQPFFTLDFLHPNIPNPNLNFCYSFGVDFLFEFEEDQNEQFSETAPPEISLEIVAFDLLDNKISPSKFSFPFSAEIPWQKEFLFFSSEVPIRKIQFFLTSTKKNPSSSSLRKIWILNLNFGYQLGNVFDGVSSQHKFIFYAAFNLGVFFLLLVDLFFTRTNSKGLMRLTSAAFQSLFYILLAFLFCTGIYYWKGRQIAVTWILSFFLEKFLSVDNLFVFLTVFSNFQIPLQFQHKILTFGILGAIVLRAFFITAGVILIEKFEFLLIFFGFFLIYTGFKTYPSSSSSSAPSNHLESASNPSNPSTDLFPSKSLKKQTTDSSSAPFHTIPPHSAIRFLQWFLPVFPGLDKSGSFFVQISSISDSEIFTASPSALENSFRSSIDPNQNSSLLPLFSASSSSSASSSASSALLQFFSCSKLFCTKIFSCFRLQNYAATRLFLVLVIIEISGTFSPSRSSSLSS
eukprot:Sdes_comp20879_c0_seq1m17874